MDVARPHRAVAPTVEGDVLVVLNGTTKPMTGRDVARLVRRRSQSAVAEALERLTVQGLVHREQVGRAFLHSLNREHLAAPAVEILAGLRARLFERLEEAFASWEVPPHHASLFGSVARGEGDTDSDIDIFLVRPRRVADDDDVWRDQVSALGYSVIAWTGNHAGIVELSRSEVPSFVRAAKPILEELRSDAITIAGSPIPVLLRPRS